MVVSTHMTPDSRSSVHVLAPLQPSRVRRLTGLRFPAVLVLVAMAIGSVEAQYPNISSKVAAESDRRRSEADQRSDEAFAHAMPTIQAWTAKGKPYIPWAAKPGGSAAGGHPGLSRCLGRRDVFVRRSGRSRLRGHEPE